MHDSNCRAARTALADKAKGPPVNNPSGPFVFPASRQGTELLFRRGVNSLDYLGSVGRVSSVGSVTVILDR